MDHVAIMNPKLGIISEILSGDKTIESRWYKTKRSPWNEVNERDRVYFKYSGKPIEARAEVDKVLQLELNSDKIREIIREYGGRGKICLNDTDYESNFYDGRKYCILIFLKNPEKIDNFHINKNGYGMGSAWLCVEDVEKIRINL